MEYKLKPNFLPNNIQDVYPVSYNENLLLIEYYENDEGKLKLYDIQQNNLIFDRFFDYVSNRISLSPNGIYMLQAFLQENYIRITNLLTGQLIRQINMIENTFSAKLNNNFVFYSILNANHSELVVVNFMTGESTTYQVDFRNLSLVLSKSGNILACYNIDRLMLFRTVNMEVIGDYQYGGSGVCFSNDGSLLAIFKNNSLMIRDINNNLDIIRTINTQGKNVLQFWFNTNGSQILLDDRRKNEVIIIKLDNSEIIQTISVNGDILNFKLSINSKYLFITYEDSGGDNAVRMYEKEDEIDVEELFGDVKNAAKIIQ